MRARALLLLLPLAACREAPPLPDPVTPEFNCPLPEAEPYDAGPLPAPGLSRDPVVDVPDLCGFDAPGLRRLNRAEYDNTVRDLLGVDLRLGAQFPAEDTGAGFDNMAALLAVSPLLLERLEASTRALLDAALAKDVVEPRVALYEAEAHASGSGYANNAWFVLNGGDPMRVPVELPAAGEYTLRLRAYRAPDGARPSTLSVAVDDRLVGAPDVAAPSSEPELLEVVFRAEQSGPAVIALTFVEPSLGGEIALDWMELDGPRGAPIGPDPEPRRRLLTCTAEELGAEACARQIWTGFAERAWRRPVSPDEITPYLALLGVAGSSPAEGATAADVFEEGVKLGLSAILLSPSFLFRVETDASNGTAPRALTDHELASRLSYFLWSTMPDERLRAIADLGSLKDPAVLEGEVRRMLRDPKARALVDNLAAQWLELRAMDHVWRPKETFPDFDGELRVNMACETKRLFHEVLTTGGTLADLVGADWTWVSERLAEHYGIEGVDGDGWHRVSLAGTGRRGILTHGSVLTLTSQPTRTSPVKRGKWVLDNLLCMPPDPPPPGVAGFPEDDGDEPATMRETLERHREDPVCASCHELMDPLGFALEGFDATGKRRDDDDGLPIDTSGVFPTGEPFAGPDDLVTLLRDTPQLTQCAAEKVLTYALGRSLDVVDACVLEDVVSRMQQGASLEDLFVLIATHPSFALREPMPVALVSDGALPEEGAP